jgi:hypothetical protein
MIPLLLLLAVDPHIVFIKSFPGSEPAYMEITVDNSGAVTYKEDPNDDDPDKFQLDANSKNQIFDLATRLDHFSHPLESGLKVARMGDKTFRWQNGSEQHEEKFNYSLDENARELQDWFERISETERLLASLDRAMRHDKLGVNDAMIALEDSWQRKRLVTPEQFLPVLDRLAKNDAYMHMDRERAARLADAIRAAKAKPE